MHRLASTALLLAFVTTTTLAADAFKVWLKFTPHDSAVQGSVASIGTLIGKTFKLGTVRDAREGDPSVIGQHVDAKATRPIVAQTDPTEFVVAGAADLLPRWGLTLVPANPDYVIDVDVVRFGINSSTFYAAEVALRFTVRNERHEVLWAGETRGTGRVLGKPLKESNVNLVLSDALKFALWEFVSEPELDANIAAGRAKKPIAAAPSSPAATKTMTPDAMLAELVKLNGAGIDEATQLDFVRGRTLDPALTADDVVRWRKAGVGDAVIRAAIAKK